VFRRKRKATDFRAEIEAHIQAETKRLREQGLSEDEARTAARRAFGNVTRAAYGVARRTHEIGVRMALGARRHEILWLTARLGLVLTLTGLAIGLAVAAGVTRYLQSLLYGVQPTDPWTFACIPILLGVVVALACYVPARRAMRVDPMVALRHE
jgi:ABC-type lipoprotein release transport system permease subunit